MSSVVSFSIFLHRVFANRLKTQLTVLCASAAQTQMQPSLIITCPDRDVTHISRMPRCEARVATMHARGQSWWRRGIAAHGMQMLVAHGCTDPLPLFGLIHAGHACFLCQRRCVLGKCVRGGEKRGGRREEKRKGRKKIGGRRGSEQREEGVKGKSRSEGRTENVCETAPDRHSIRQTRRDNGTQRKM